MPTTKKPSNPMPKTNKPIFICLGGRKFDILIEKDPLRINQRALVKPTGTERKPSRREFRAIEKYLKAEGFV